MALRLTIALLACARVASAGVDELPALSSCADVHATFEEMRERFQAMPAARRSELGKRLQRDPADLEARGLVLTRMARRAPQSRETRETVEWLVSTCPATPLLAHPSVARIASPALDTLWSQKVRHHRTAAVLGNYWSYRAARQPLDLRPRATDPKWSAGKRKHHIAAYRHAGPAASDRHKLAFRAFEALRLELRIGGTDIDTLLAAARAAFDAGFQDAAERFAGELLSLWNRRGRKPMPEASRALGLLARTARSRGDVSLARSARLAATRLR